MRRSLPLSLALFLILVLMSSAVAAQQPTEHRFDGYLDDAVPSKSYTLTLEAGQALLVVTEATSGDLDTVVSVFAPDGSLVAQNDDRSDETLDSALGFVAEVGGEFRVIVERYNGTGSSGHYRLRMVVGEPDVLDELETLTRVQLSGPMLVLESENFRVHYTLEGADRVLSEEYAQQVADTAEATWRVQIGEMGWPTPPGDGVLGGDPRFDIYIKDLLGAGEEAFGFAVPDAVVGDNPNTPVEEVGSSGSYLVIENDFAGAEDSGASALSLMRTTVIHELNHALQFGFDANDSQNWIYEATATWMETAAAGKDQDATGYVVDAFDYPELCFGTVNDPGEGAVQYGEWPFLQLMVDELGADSVVQYWENIALDDGWQALADTLDAYDFTLPDFVARYRVKNLARDYTLAPLFDATLWLENTITDVGRWTFTGQGIQELGANYYRFEAPAGSYYAGIVNDGGSLELYAIGVGNGKVEAIALGRGGTFSTEAYDDVYLMVFNPVYDDDLTDCVYESYDLDIDSAKSPPTAAAFSYPSTYYEALEMAEEQ